ncbi:hypothetical protein E1267_05840 [Nonomuraea longispora]|uniref:Uncharacterized protein n=1 Tax=Nonomuraea longispora TaxID=1848320 RepID=A0A4R4NLA3_9ACTN|nr:hypothetical protein [Nonomuraea longispora]TDC09949.1 hypothetical protein E1267_05840 [Nonomuraea longispora]
MTTRSAAALASGTANTAKLFVAALAFTSAYVGFSAYHSANSATQPVTTITLSARETPISAPARRTSPAAREGEVSVDAVPDGGAGCAGSYVARSVVVNPDPDQAVSYAWRLTRWSPAIRTWRTYLVDHDGSAAARRTVEWRPQMSGNPGWYRVELAVKGAATVRSERFEVSC